MVQVVIGCIIITFAVAAIVKRVDVRLVLFVAALAMGAVAGQIWPIVRVFFETLANERFVVPICCAMGFAYTLRHTGCDQHLVHLLVRPLTRVRFLLIPGTVVAGYVVNIPIISQTSTAASLGPVVIPILTAARIRAPIIGAVLLLGCSVGGELLNPGAPELRTIVEESRKLVRERGESHPDFDRIEQIHERDVSARILPLNLLALAVATLVFWCLAWREERRIGLAEIPAESIEQEQQFQVNYLKAAIPFIPMALLFMTGPPLNWLHVPWHWLVPVAAGSSELPSNLTGLYNSRLIGAAMLVGVICAALASWRSSLEVPKKFFEGAGYAFAYIISLIVTARCFGEAIKHIGIARALAGVIAWAPVLLMPLAGACSLLFAVLSGSGMATTQSLFATFAASALDQSVDPTLVGAVVSLASAAGRTMSPVAAVCLMSATLTDTNPFELSRRVALPLIAGVAAVVVAALFVA